MTVEVIGPRRSGITRAWIVPFGILAGFVAASLGGLLSRSLFLDLFAWWPAWLILALLARVSRGGRLGAVRLPGLVALLGLVVVLVFGVGHLQGWGLMPSVAGRLIGPEVGEIDQAALTAAIDGTLNVTTHASFLYEVIPIRRGGTVGVPDATEETFDSTRIEVVLEVPEDPGFQRFAGWNVRLSVVPAWSLDLSGAIDADLSNVTVEGLRLAGQGNVSLGLATTVTTVIVDGTFTIELPSTAVVRVFGTAQVPVGWDPLEDGWQSPLTGDGWEITVSPGSTLVITTSN